MFRMTLIGMVLGCAALTAGCAGAGPNGEIVEDVDQSEQIDHASSALVKIGDAAATPDQTADQTNGRVDDGSSTLDTGHQQTGADDSPSGKAGIRMDPEPCPWTQKRNTGNDT
jgi:hypothetical protein